MKKKRKLILSTKKRRDVYFKFWVQYVIDTCMFEVLLFDTKSEKKKKYIIYIFTDNFSSGTKYPIMILVKCLNEVTAESRSCFMNLPLKMFTKITNIVHVV